MTEEKLLFSVAVDDISSHVRLHTETREDVFALSLAIAKTMDEHPDICIGVLTTLKLINECNEFKDELDESTVDMSQFDNILKDAQR